MKNPARVTQATRGRDDDDVCLYSAGSCGAAHERDDSSGDARGGDGSRGRSWVVAGVIGGTASQGAGGAEERQAGADAGAEVGGGVVYAGVGESAGGGIAVVAGAAPAAA